MKNGKSLEVPFGQQRNESHAMIIIHMSAVIVSDKSSLDSKLKSI
jgi:hypothetical protein